jgi:hypothetical protein
LIIFIWADVLFFPGEWSEVHESKADQGDITKMRRSKAVGQHALKLALFRDIPHEAIAPQPEQDPEQLVLFEPGLCLRGAEVVEGPVCLEVDSD